MKIFLKGLLSMLLFLIATNPDAIAQTHINVNDLHPENSEENILVHPLTSDSLGSSYIIWVKNGVKAHVHKFHSEMVYVLEGSGMLYMAEDSMRIQPGDYFHFPPNTVHAVKVDATSHMKVLSVQMPEFFGRDRHFMDLD